MNCKNHPGYEAVYVCRNCGQAMCLDCTVELNGRNYCRECLANIVNNTAQQGPTGRDVVYTRKKSKFFTFVFGLVPGGGHMYLGLINRGMTLMVTFFAALFTAIFFSDILGIHWISGFFIPAVCVLSVFYSVFDSRFLANEINEGRVVTDSEGIRINTDYDQIRIKFLSNKKIIAYGLIILGVIGTFNVAIEGLREFLWRVFRFSFPYYLSLPRFIIPIAMMIGGVYLLRKGRRDSF